MEEIGLILKATAFAVRVPIPGVCNALALSSTRRDVRG